MKKQYVPYYISRMIIAIGFALLVYGITWKAAFFAAVLLGLFLLYLHSGWFAVDLSHPFFPLRRDDHGKHVQRKALIAAVVTGLLLYMVLRSGIGSLSVFSHAGGIALSLGIIAYFITQIALFMRA